MIWLTLILIPIILLFLWKVVETKVVTFYVIPFGLILFPILFNYFGQKSQTDANEILGGNINSATYYEEWNEWISQTCTRQNCTGTGKDQVCTTESYDCSHEEDHPAEWVASTSFGDMSIDAGKFNYLVSKFKNKTFEDMHRHYYTQDGNAYHTTWNSDSATLEPYFINHTYENRIQNSRSIFNYSPADTIAYKLIHKISANDGEAVGYVNGSQKANDIVNYYNAIFGKIKQLRLIIVNMGDQPFQAGVEEEKYWKGANKNEFVVTIGVKQGNISWVHPFSWMKNKSLEYEVRDSISNMKIYNDVNIANYVGKIVPGRWERRHFKEFKYIDVPVGTAYIIACYFVMIVLSIFYCIFVIKSEE